VTLRGSHADDFSLRWIAAHGVADAIGPGTRFVAGWNLGRCSATRPSQVRSSVRRFWPSFSEPPLRAPSGGAGIPSCAGNRDLRSAQWIALRDVITGGKNWFWANALAWGVAMPLVFTGMDAVPWTSGDAAINIRLRPVGLWLSWWEASTERC
jgi:hypothetical protein